MMVDEQNRASPRVAGPGCQPVASAAVPASSRSGIPDAWGIIINYGVDVVMIDRVSPQTVWYRLHEGSRTIRVARHKLVFSAADEALVRRTAAKLQSARGESRRRERAARVWLSQEISRIVASAIEARRAATGTGAVEDESAVGDSRDAPTSPETTPQEPGQ